MPSDRKQFNVRMSDDTAARVERLLPVVQAALKIEVSQAQFFALAVAALEEQYGGAPAAEPPGKGKKPKK